MTTRLALSLYTAFMHLLWPVARWRWARRARTEPLYGQGVPERAGRYANVPSPGAGDPPRVWVHAVSLGETRAAASLIAALRLRMPGVRLLLTHGTATGREEGLKLLQPGDQQVWAPFDTPAATRRFLTAFRPDLGVLMETEVWPNLLHAARLAQVPMLLANARLSARSLRAAQRLGALSVPAYGALTDVLAQTEADAARLVQAGVAAAHVRVAGNLKFDMDVPAQSVKRGQAWREALARPVLMLASSRDGEERQLLAAWRPVREALQARVDRPAVPLLLIVPRHPQRFDEVAALVRDAGWSLARRSSLAAAPGGSAWPDPQVDVLLGDSLGEMALYYGLADLSWLGGSFGGTGGQNLIEAAACGCPVVLGPSTYNFAQAAEQSVAAGAAWRVPDMAAAVQRATELLGQPQALVAAARASERFALAHRGAAERMADVIATRVLAAKQAPRLP
jgi:3-deoxy-D-manno-octulosonic-acid transferase